MRDYKQEYQRNLELYPDYCKLTYQRNLEPYPDFNKRRYQQSLELHPDYNKIRYLRNKKKDYFLKKGFLNKHVKVHECLQ